MVGVFTFVSMDQLGPEAFGLVAFTILGDTWDDHFPYFVGSSYNKDFDNYNKSDLLSSYSHDYGNNLSSINNWDKKS